MRSAVFILAIAGGIGALAAPTGHAQPQSAGGGQYATSLFQRLEADGYDMTGFEYLTLVQVAMIEHMLDEDHWGATSVRIPIQAMLNGACGYAVIQNTRPSPGD
jgi:hypothetical protein